MSNQIELKVVVNGTPTTVTANVNAPLKTIIPEALKKTGNVGQPPENWLIKDAAGNELNRDEKISSFGFTGDTVLYLSLGAGIGG